MGCYTVPLAAAVVHYIMRKKSSSLRNNKDYLWLNLLFAGAAIFGVVDHLWNGELFAFSLSDVLLGFVITVVIFAFWQIIVFRNSCLNLYLQK